jgi:hypothetical protein
MSVAALSTAGFSQYIAASSNVSASQSAFQSLQQSLASGNLTAAKSAFNTYQQLNQAPATTATSSSGTAASSSSTSNSSSGTTTTSQFSKDLAALGSAINSGSLSAAQSAFTTLQGDLKTTPSQAIANAETAVAQTVQWVDDLLSLAGSSSAPSTPVDPMSSILDSAYGLPTSSTPTDPTTAILENAYDPSGTGSGTTTSSAESAASKGNIGSAASVNVYA